MNVLPAPQQPMPADTGTPTSADALLGTAAQPGDQTQPLKDLAALEPDPLARKWAKRIKAAIKHWEKFHQRVQYNRELVAGFDWSKDAKSAEFYKLRANLIHGTITAMLPTIYARNPEISFSPAYRKASLKKFCSTIEAVTNRHLHDAGLKSKAKRAVRAAITVSWGVLKVVYQRDYRSDPVVLGRIKDTQDNIARIEQMLATLEDPQQRADEETRMAELRQALEAMEQQTEVVAAEGITVSKLLTEHLIVDPGVAEFEDYAQGEFMTERIPMRKSAAEAKFKVKLDKATRYESDAMAAEKGQQPAHRGLASGKPAGNDDDDCFVCVLETWDITTNSVLTMVEGIEDQFVAPPFTPKKQPERFYPYFILPFQLVDGQMVGPSLPDLTEKLQAEHNKTRDTLAKHRDLAKPGYLAAAETDEKSLKRLEVADFGEITLVDTEGKPLNQVIAPKQYPPIDAAVYDTSPVRNDWEQVTGLQDAARSTIVQPKTATEASIMQQALSGRVSEFRDQTEDWIAEICDYTAQMLLMELTREQVERIMGPGIEKPVIDPATGAPAVDPMTGQPITTMEYPYDWPELTREQVYDMIELKLRAGSTGAPNKLEEQEAWGKLLPVLEKLIAQIAMGQQQGMDVEPYTQLLKHTLQRFDDKLDPEQFIPRGGIMPTLPGMPPGAGGALPAIPPQPGAEPPASEQAPPVPADGTAPIPGTTAGPAGLPV